ncbi:hypothetical protein GCM10023185_16130 [Hymenobacter saemangeumensis]|uniref:DUF4136 domain-containing protein n=2 Tax=Hymenobacter saemangeumensis TaxID=1084522 RepID=A0ABP8I9S3_9BACT
MTLSEARVESDYSYSGKFHRYRTFEFMQGPGLASDSSEVGKVLREAIHTRLRQQGYRPAASGKPDLLVNFQLFAGNIRLRGYEQQSLEEWIKRGYEDDEYTPERMRQTYQPVNMLMSDGTLMVTLIDARNQRAVWNGYASGVEVPNGISMDLLLRRTVRSIFDNYRVFTEGYLMTPQEARSGGRD